MRKPVRQLQSNMCNCLDQRIEGLEFARNQVIEQCDCQLSPIAVIRPSTSVGELSVFGYSIRWHCKLKWQPSRVAMSD